MNLSYIAIDGDNVGQKIEWLVVNERPKELTTFSNNYHQAMEWLEQRLESRLVAKIIFNGGDSLLAAFEHKNSLSLNELETIRKRFLEIAQTTISIGIGGNLRQAYFALKLAKAKGRDRIEIFEEFVDEQL